MQLARLLNELLGASERRLQNICRANDRNGDWDFTPHDVLLTAILRWAASEPNFEGTLRFLLELA